MCESHALGSKIVISRSQTNFSHLADNSERNCLKTLEKLSEHLRNSLIMLEIGWKSFGNCCPCVEVIKNLSTPSVIFGSRREIFDNLRKSSETFGDLWKSSKNFGNLRKPSVYLRKSRVYGDEKSRTFTEKKLAGILSCLSTLYSVIFKALLV